MRLDVEAERLLVISDLHLGSPASHAVAHLPTFIDMAIEGGWSLCVNGDALDLLQGRPVDLGADLLVVVRLLRRLVEAGGDVLYVLGNHDLAIEHWLADLPFVVSPFLNVTSGSERIRIEHGHVHEPFYARWPRVYEFGGHAARPFLLANADVYGLWSRAQLAVDRRRRGRGRPYPHHEAARALFQRGFDAVVFGHTHLPEMTELDGGTFVNSGHWMESPTFVRIEHGAITLERWDPESRGTRRP